MKGRHLLVQAMFAVSVGLTSPSAAEEPQYGPERRMKGTFASGFETSTFAGCWFKMRHEAWREFQALVPSHEGAFFENADFALEIVGREATAVRPPHEPGTTPPMPQGFGHLGMASCQIEAVRVLSARRLDKVTVK